MTTPTAIAPLKPAADLTPARQIGLTPQSIDEALRMAEIMSKASIVPKDFQGNPGNILVAIQWGAELGLPPLQAMQSIAVINGRPAVWGDAVIALVRGSGHFESIQEDVTDTAATCTVKRRGETPTARTFTLEDAKKAGLAGKPGPWTQYPKRMMQMRARAWALRDVFPDVLRGIHVAEEALDIPSERPMGPAEIIEQAPGGTRTEAVKAKLVAKTRKAAAPAADLDDVLSAIASAETMDALNATKPLIKALSADDRAAAIEAGKARRAALEAAPDITLTPPDALAEILSGIDRTDPADLDIWLDEAREQGLSAEDTARVEAAIAARMAGTPGVLI